MIGAPDDAPASLTKPSSPSRIDFTAMLGAIRLDDHPHGGAGKVDDVRADWELATKLEAVQPTSSQ